MKLDFLPIMKREVRSQLTNPGFYVVLGLFFLISGMLFYSATGTYIQDSMQQAANPDLFEEPVNYTQDVVSTTFGSIGFLYIFIIPIFCMRLISEEKSLGTIEILATSPVSDWGIILGKFLGMVAINLMIIAGLLIPVGFMVWMGEPETMVIVVSLAGLLLIGVAYSAFGLFASSISTDQLTAAIVGFVGLLILYLLSYLAPNASGLLLEIVNGLSMSEHSSAIMKGAFQFENVLYFVLFTLFFLVLSHTILRARQWRM